MRAALIASIASQLWRGQRAASTGGADGPDAPEAVDPAAAGPLAEAGRLQLVREEEQLGRVVGCVGRVLDLLEAEVGKELDGAGGGDDVAVGICGRLSRVRVGSRGLPLYVSKRADSLLVEGAPVSWKKASMAASRRLCLSR